MSRVCVLLAPGFEEIEAVTVIDVLRRADIETVVLAVEDAGAEVLGAHGIALRADGSLSERISEPWDLVVLPGGMPGSANLRDSAPVQQLLRNQLACGGDLAAICAAPIALSTAGALEGRAATSYPSFADQLSCDRYKEQPVVIDAGGGPGDSKVVTSRGPGTALAFALTLVREICGAERATKLGEQMLVPPG